MIGLTVYPVYIYCSTGEIKIKNYDVNKKSYGEIFDEYTSLVSYMNEVDNFYIADQIQL